MKKIRIAFVHTTGLSTGGTEQFLQRLAVALPKNKYEIDFYYANHTDNNRKQFVLENGVKIYKFRCGKIIEKSGVSVAFDCNFKKIFRNDYDLIQLGTDGVEIPYLNFICKTPIIDSIHYVNGVNNKYNISRVLHISNFSKKVWIKKGGDKERVEMISLPLKSDSFSFTDIRSSLGLESDCFIFGMHQANRDDIFSEIPLKAYKEIESGKNAYVLLNGSKLYRCQAKALNLKRVFFYDFVQNNDEFYSILNSFNVYAHGRKDGELNSASIAEAMSLGLPIITHPSKYFNGHLEVIADNGFIAKDYLEYAQYMRLLESNYQLRKKCGNASAKCFREKYDHDRQMRRIEDIYDCILDNPFPNRKRRIILDMGQKFKNNILRLVIYILFYQKSKE